MQSLITTGGRAAFTGCPYKQGIPKRPAPRPVPGGQHLYRQLYWVVARQPPNCAKICQSESIADIHMHANRKPRYMQGRTLTADVKAIVDEQMQKDDETTVHQLYHLLQSRGYNISLGTILHCRKALGWTFRGSAYCQLIRDANKVKHLEWDKKNETLKSDKVLWMDECMVQLEAHRRFCCRIRGQPAKLKPR